MGNNKHSTPSTSSSSRKTKPTTSRRTTQTSDESPRGENPDDMGNTTESDRLVKQNLELLESGNYADVDIICNGRLWRAHKLILRSRCAWFEKAFANNWQEAQTGCINLREQQPERVHDVLKFIYSGRYTAKVAGDAQSVSVPILEATVSVWQTADYFLLPCLMAEVYEYLLDRIAATLRLVNAFKVTRPIGRRVSINDRDLGTLLADLFAAVKTAYKCHTARDIHKLLAFLACGLREQLTESVLWDLMKIPGFQNDMSTALIAIHFTQATKGVVASTLQTSITTATNAAKCHGKESGKNAKHSQEDFSNMVLDPFSTGVRRWCDACAIPSIKSQLKIMIKAWPIGPDEV